MAQETELSDYTTYSAENLRMKLIDMICYNILTIDKKYIYRAFLPSKKEEIQFNSIFSKLSIHLLA